MAARHRWLFPEAAPPKTAAWFLWHRALQLAGLLVFGVAFLLPYVAFGGHSGDMMSTVHTVSPGGQALPSTSALCCRVQCCVQRTMQTSHADKPLAASVAVYCDRHVAQAVRRVLAAMRLFATLQAHQVIGIALACAAGMQLVLAFVRPRPDAEIRK